MHRRHLLAVAATAAGLSGCIDNGDGTGGPGENGTNDGMNGNADGGDPVPTVEDQSIETTSAECASGGVGDATVERADGTVTVAGSLETPNPCHEAVLDSVSIDEGRLHAVVEATSTSDMCEQCIGAVEYEATVDVANAGALTGATVDHADGGSFGADWSGESS